MGAGAADGGELSTGTGAAGGGELSTGTGAGGCTNGAGAGVVTGAPSSSSLSVPAIAGAAIAAIASRVTGVRMSERWFMVVLPVGLRSMTGARACGVDGLHLGGRPLVERHQRARQAPPEGRQRVLHAHGDVGVGAAGDEPVALQRAQRLREG